MSRANFGSTLFTSSNTLFTFTSFPENRKRQPNTTHYGFLFTRQRVASFVSKYSKPYIERIRPLGIRVALHRRRATKFDPNSKMSESPVRPSRRAAARKKVVIESDEDDELMQPKMEEDEEDFTPAPAPKRSPRKAPASRRKTTNTIPTPRTGGRVKKSIANENIEPSEIFDPEETAQPTPESPSKRASPRKRKSAPARGSRVSSTPELPPPLPTPQASVSPEPSELHGTPLADITLTINDRPRTADSQTSAVKAIRPLDTVLEKPMDIVLKSRSLAVPVVEETGPKARIVITYLILTNFKSYAGRQEVGPFHASFSSVVGPNGSGKSNVIDSLLFVFGFRASKMRQGKISALIHNSAAFPDLDFCEVAVHFQEVMDQVSL
jgi:structural maintenance of chromosome 4